MRARLILGATILLTGCGDDGGGPTDDFDLSGVWSLSGEAESTGGLSGACTFVAGTLALTQTGTTARGTIDGRLSCDIPDIGSFTDDVDEPVEGIQVDGDNVSWSQDDCEFTGEAQTDDHIEGDLNCTTSYLGAPVNVVGTWQMSR